jgi:hypothetical protein
VKKCSKCDVMKPLTEFWLRSNRPSQVRTACKTCESATYRAWKAEHGLEAQRRWRAAHPEVARAGYRRKKLKQKYGLTPKEADLMLARGCSICGSHDQTCIDHDHSIGFVRGALCRRCNLGIGHLDDDPARLRAAADYLERHTKE